MTRVLLVMLDLVVDARRRHWELTRIRFRPGPTSNVERDRFYGCGFSPRKM